jgi:hypothetical protein
MYKDEYVCSSIKNNVWYVYNNHRWEVDNGKTLRLAISKAMCGLYLKKCKEYERDTTGKSVDKKEMIKRVISKLKTTSDKNNIMREAQDLFRFTHLETLDAPNSISFPTDALKLISKIQNPKKILNS